jgi:hypothetical protein
MTLEEDDEPPVRPKAPERTLFNFGYGRDCFPFTIETPCNGFEIRSHQRRWILHAQR